MSLHFSRHTGAAIADVFEPLARLRIDVFRDFPYLYDGNTDYEREYLGVYARSERALLFCVHDGERMVGATTAIPLVDETDAVQAPFIRAGFDRSSIFYFGESILLPPYRGRGWGNRFFDEREQHALRFGDYHTTCFCAVDRPANHPLRPADYRPLDPFWQKRGYRKEPALTSVFVWPDLQEPEPTPKDMIYWTKSWD